MRESRRARWIAGLTLLLIAIGGVAWWRLRPAPVGPRVAEQVQPARPSRLAPPKVMVPAGRVAAPDPTAPSRASVSGKVVAASSGTPIAGAEVAFDVGGGLSAVRTGADGAFRFESDQPGRVRLASVRAASYFPFAPELDRSRVVFDLAPGVHVQDVVLSLEERLSFEGKVVDRDERPVPGARVAVISLGNVEAELEPLNLVYQTDAQGAFLFEAPPGAELEATHPGFLPAREDVGVVAQAGRSLTLRMTPRTGAVEPGAPVAGRLVGPAGEPVAGKVTARAQSRPFVAIADPSGRFELPALPPGRYELTGSAPGYGPATARDVPPGKTDVVLQLTRGLSVAGRVVDAEHEPVTAFTVVADAVTGPLVKSRLNAVTGFDREGRFVIGDLPPGSIALTAIAQDGAPSKEVTVTLAPGQEPSEVLLVLQQGRTLRGKVVVEGSGEAVAEARVTVDGNPAGDLGVSMRGFTVTGPDGRFELRGLPAGNHSLVVWAQGFHGRILPGVSVPADADPKPVETGLTRLQAGESATLEIAGIGAVLVPDGQVLRVKRVVSGGGAAEAGLTAGDGIVSIDGRPVTEIGYGESVELIRGPVGTVVRLGLRRGDNGPVVDLTVVRRKIRV